MTSKLANYRPNPLALQALKDVTLVAVVGPSGVGKTTLMNRAVKAHPELHLVVGDTSRAPRPGEKEGVDYYFRTREAMLGMIGRRHYVQLAPSVMGDLYATRPESYGDQGIAMLAVLADAMPAFRTLPLKALRTIFITPPSYEIWQERLQNAGRNLSAEHISQRLSEARRSFEFALIDPDIQFVINDDLQTAQKAFIDIAQGEVASSQLVRARVDAHRIIKQILSHLAS